MNSDEKELQSSLQSASTLNAQKSIELAVVGSAGVGKSALILRFKDNIFKEMYEPTSYEKTSKTVDFNNQTYQVTLHDIEGQTRYAIMPLTKMAYKLDGILLVYSLENRQSFELVKILDNKITHSIGRTVPRILVGNKTDLLANREVTQEEGENMAKSLGIPYVECSAKKGECVNEVFNGILLEINKHENNIDFNKLSCRRLLEFFIAHEKVMIKVFYAIILLNILFSLFYFGFGVYLSTVAYTENMVVMFTLLLALWLGVFSFLGYYGLAKKKKEFLNYHSIGIAASTLMTLTYLILLATQHIMSRSEYQSGGFKVVVYLVSTVNFLLEILSLFMSGVFQKIFIEELSSYMMI